MQKIKFISLIFTLIILSGCASTGSTVKDTNTMINFEKLIEKHSYCVAEKPVNYRSYGKEAGEIKLDFSEFPKKLGLWDLYNYRKLNGEILVKGRTIYRNTKHYTLDESIRIEKIEGNHLSVRFGEYYYLANHKGYDKELVFSCKNPNDIQIDKFIDLPFNFSQLEEEDKYKIVEDALTRGTYHTWRPIEKASSLALAKYFANLDEFHTSIKKIIENKFNRRHGSIQKKTLSYLVDFMSYTKQIKQANTLEQIKNIEEKAINKGVTLQGSLLAIKNNQINFQNKYKYYLLKATEDELKQVLNNKNILKGVDQIKISKVKNKLHKLESKRLIKFYRNQKTFNGYLNAFKYSKDKIDIQDSYKTAKTNQEKVKAEKALITTLAGNKVFDIKLIGTQQSKVEVVGGNAFFNLSGASLSGKDFIKDFKLSSKIPLKYGEYKIKVNFTLNLTYSKNYMGFTSNPTHQKEYSVIYSINKSNDYVDEKTVKFEDVRTGVKGGAFGLNTLNMELIKSNISYEIEDIN